MPSVCSTVGTSAVRDADNGEAFLGEVEWSYGFTTRLLDGGEEAEMMLRGVASDHAVAAGTLVVDIGGGSTELVAHGRQPSLVGEQHRCRQRPAHGAVPPLRPTDRRGARRLCRARPLALAPAPPHECRRRRGGTIVTAATISVGAETSVHGHRLSARAARSALERVASLPLAEREQVAGLHPARAPVIVAGRLVLRVALAHYGLTTIEVSERDLLHGAALAASELPEPEEGPAPPGAYTCC